MSSWRDSAQRCLQAAYVAAQFSPRVKFLSPVLTVLNCYRRWPRSRRCASPSSDLARRTARHDLETGEKPAPRPSMSRDGSRWQKRVPGQERERRRLRRHLNPLFPWLPGGLSGASLAGQGPRRRAGLTMTRWSAPHSFMAREQPSRPASKVTSQLAYVALSNLVRPGGPMPLQSFLLPSSVWWLGQGTAH